MSATSYAETKTERRSSDDPLDFVAPAGPQVQAKAPPRRRVLPVLITLVMVTAAALLGWAAWGVYMEGPWTRDGTVRAYVATMAPEVAGRVVELPIADNQLVRKGGLLMVVDPTNFRIALELASATVQQAQANAQTIAAQIAIQQAQIDASEAQVEQAKAALTFAEQQSVRYRDLARTEAGTVQMEQQTAATLGQDQAALKNAQAALTAAQRQIESLKAQQAGAQASIAQAEAQRDQARVNLDRTRIVSPVDGYVTNLLVQLGDYVNVGTNSISLVDAHSFWVDGYFEETSLARIKVGDPAQLKLLGYREPVRGHVGSIARGINVANAQPNQQGLANVNPIFTWVRLAQRIPVRIDIDKLPPGVTLVAGMTVTVQVDPRKAPAQH